MSITWNGVSSDTIGVIVERIPNRYVPTRRFSPQQAAGRNGNILLVDKSFPNVEQEYEVYLSAEAQGLPSVARACAEWLMGPDGYCRLEDSYDTTVYREAFLMGGYDLENILNKFGRCTITFSCKPQKYLLTGDTPIEIPAGTTTTYTGSSVQFDGVTGASITSLSTTITPTQDLHGYDSPWPAGGGKNKLDAEYSESITTSKTFVFDTPLPAGTYTFSFQSSDTSSQVTSYQLGIYKDTTGSYVFYDVYPSSKKRTFTISETCSKIILFSNRAYNESVGFTTVFSGLMIESGSSASSWEPYENICPISGIDNLSVYVSPTTQQAQATTYNVSFGAAGTVYGGTLDVVTGLLTADRASKVFNGSERWDLWNGVFVNYDCTDIKTEAAETSDTIIIADRFKPNGVKYRAGCGDGNIIKVVGDNPQIACYSSAYADEVAFKASLANSPMTVCYELATPLTYQLTAQEIGVLVGENNVWTSAGSVSVTVVTPLGGIVTNPTPFEARPMLEVSGVGEITINGKSIQILESVSDFQIDCEAMEAEDNSKIYCVDFPELSGGENEIVGDGSITALTVTPRWWTL